jgi:hypothetical protein
VAIKIKMRRPDAPEAPVDLAEVDQVLHASQETFGFLQDNRNAVVGLIAAIVIGVVVGSVLLKNRSDAADEAASGLYTALNTLTQEVGEGAEYTEVSQRAGAALAAAETVIAEHPQDGLGTTERAVAGQGALQAGDAVAAVTHFEAYRAGNENRAEANAAAFGEASARAASGDLAGARGLMASLADDEAIGFVAALHSARLVDTFGENAEALETYRELLYAHPEQASGAYVDHRITQLEIELNVEPAPPAAAEAANEE